MSLSPYVGYGITTLLNFLVNKRSNSRDETKAEPSDLNVSKNESKIGSTIPVVLGRGLIKSPIVAYFGDFSYKRYTETYSAHAKFNGMALVLSLILAYIAKPAPITVNPGQSVTTTGGKGFTDSTGTAKDPFIGKLLYTLFMWLLNWLINGRNLKTTIQKGFKYYLGYQYLVSWSGKNMVAKKIYLDENEVWDGSAAYGTTPKLHIDKPDLFGGVDERGGFVGNINLYMGGNTQMPDPWMVDQMKADSVQKELRGLTPAYRPFVSIVVPKAYIGKQATIPKLWIELQNIPTNLELGAIGEDANPAEVIYEIITNDDWGLCENPDCLDLDALRELGRTCADEGLGISVVLNQTQKALDLLEAICAHIDAVRYADPHTGKTVFKLIRDNYDIDECLLLNTSNCSQVVFSRLDWSQTISKVSVDFTNPQNVYEVATVPTNDPASFEIANQSTTVKSYDYSYFTTPANAVWAAKRELRQQAYPLASFSITGNRELFEVRIGDVVLLSWPPYGISSVPVRVTNVDISEFTSGEIHIDGIEDVFGLGKTDYNFPAGSLELENEMRPPDKIEYYAFFEIPYGLTSVSDTYVGAVATQPSDHTYSWSVERKYGTRPFYVSSSLSEWTTTGALVYGLPEFSSVESKDGFRISNIVGVDLLDTGDPVGFDLARRGDKLVLIDDEIIAYNHIAKNSDGSYQLKGVLRGVFDTVPAEHNANSTVFFLKDGTYQLTNSSFGPICDAGTTKEELYALTTATSRQHSPIDYADVVTFKTQRRAERPVPPGRVRMSDWSNDEEFYLSDVVGDLTISYTPRDDRVYSGVISQDDLVTYGTGYDFTAAQGTSYILELSNGTDTMTVTTTDNDITVTWEGFCYQINNIQQGIEVYLKSKNGDLESYQAQHRLFNWEIPVLAGIVKDKDEANQLLQNHGQSSYYSISSAKYDVSLVEGYDYMPFFLQGTKDPQGSVRGADGELYSVTGKIYCMKDFSTIVERDMKDYFAFTSYFSDSGKTLLEFYNGAIQERVKRINA